MYREKWFSLVNLFFNKEVGLYAVIRTGAKQYRVSPGTTITVEKIPVAEGKRYTFEDVLLYHDGKRLITDSKELAKVKVTAKVTGQGKGSKVLIFKYRPKKGYRRKKGHRQMLTQLTINDIIMRKQASAGKKSSVAEKAGGKPEAATRKKTPSAKAAGEKSENEP